MDHFVGRRRRLKCLVLPDSSLDGNNEIGKSGTKILVRSFRVEPIPNVFVQLNNKNIKFEYFCANLLDMSEILIELFHWSNSIEFHRQFPRIEEWSWEIHRKCQLAFDHHFHLPLCFYPIFHPLIKNDNYDIIFWLTVL